MQERTHICLLQRVSTQIDALTVRPAVQSHSIEVYKVNLGCQPVQSFHLIFDLYCALNGKQTLSPSSEKTFLANKSDEKKSDNQQDSYWQHSNNWFMPSVSWCITVYHGVSQCIIQEDHRAEQNAIGLSNSYGGHLPVWRFTHQPLVRSSFIHYLQENFSLILDFTNRIVLTSLFLM